MRAALQQSYGALEEAKADIAGLFALQYLIDKGVLDRALERSVYVTFLASTFRTLRFGGDAHAVGMALQLNTLARRGRGPRREGRHLLRRSGEDQGARCAI